LSLSALPKDAANTIKAKEYSSDPYEEDQTTDELLFLLEILKMHASVLFQDDQKYGKLTTETVSQAMIMEMFPKLSPFISDYWEQVVKITSAINSSFKFNQFIEDLGLQEYVDVEQIKRLSKDFFEITVEKESIEDMLETFEHFKKVLYIFDLDEVAIEKGLKKLVSKEESTVNDIFAAFNMNNQAIKEFLDNVSKVIQNENSNIGDILNIFNIRGEQLDKVIKGTNEFFVKKEITNQKLKTLLSDLLTFIFEVTGSLVSKPVDILQKTISPILSKKEMTPGQKFIAILSDMETILNLFDVNTTENEEIRPYLSIINLFVNEGINLSYFIEDPEDRVTYSKVIDLLTGKETIYNFTQMFFGDSPIFYAIKALHKKETPINELLKISEDSTDLILGLISNIIKMSGEKITENPQLSFPESYYDRDNSINFQSAVNSLISFLEEKIKIPIKKYKAETQVPLIDSEKGKILRSAINTFNSLLKSFKENIKGGKTIEESLKNSLTSVNKEVYGAYLDYVIKEMNNSFEEKFQNNQQFKNSVPFDQLYQNLTQSNTLQDFYNSIYKIDWSNISNFNPGSEEEYYFIETFSKIAIPEIFASLLPSNYKYGSYSLATYLISFLDDSINPNNLQAIFDGIDWISSTFLDQPHIKGLMQNYFKGTINILRRLSKALKTEKAMTTTSAVNFKFIYDILSTTDESITSLGNPYSNAFLLILSPYYLISDLFANQITNKDITNIISDDLDPIQVAKVIDFFLEYADAIESNSSILNVFKNHTNYDGSSILDPIKPKIQFIHDIFGRESTYSESISKTIQFIGKLQTEKNEVFNWIFGSDYIQLAYNKFINKEFLNCDPSFLVSKCDQLLYYTEAFSKFDEKFTFKSLIDNTEFMFKEELQQLAGIYEETKSVTEIIKEQKMGPFDIVTSLNNIKNINSENINNVQYAKQIIHSIVLYDGINVKNINSQNNNDIQYAKQVSTSNNYSLAQTFDNFCKEFTTKTTDFTVTDLSNYINVNISNLASNIMESNNTILTHLPNNGSIISKDSFNNLANVLNDFANNGFTKESVGNYIDEITGNKVSDPDDGSLSAGAKAGIAIACIVVVAAVAGGVFWYIKKDDSISKEEPADNNLPKSDDNSDDNPDDIYLPDKNSEV
jgi:hypothetical protein